MPTQRHPDVSKDHTHDSIFFKYDKESHAAGGAIIGITLGLVLQGHLPHWAILSVAVIAAILVGTHKEYFLDKNPDNRDISFWGLGAAAALSVLFSFT